MNKKRKKQIIEYVATKCAWLLILGFGKTGRLVVKNKHYKNQALNSGRPVLYIVWHGRMLAPIYIMRNRKIAAMVSEHGDGEIIAQTILKLGYRTVRGSSTRGGLNAFKDMLKLMKNGYNCAVLPDGPVGPKQEMKMGSILLAQRSGGYLVPITFTAQKSITMKSWDGFTLWKPFSKVAVVFGKPMLIPRKLNPSQLEEHRIRVEKSMNDLQREVDEIFQS